MLKNSVPPDAPLVTISRTALVVSGSYTGGLGVSEDLAGGVAGHADGQPTHEAQVDVGGDLEAELADVEVECRVLVEDEDLGDGE